MGQQLPQIGIEMEKIAYCNGPLSKLVQLSEFWGYLIFIGMISYSVIWCMWYTCNFIRTWSVCCLFHSLVLHQFLFSWETQNAGIGQLQIVIRFLATEITSAWFFCGMRKDHLNLLGCHNSHSLWKSSVVKVLVIITTFVSVFGEEFLTHFTSNPIAYASD